MNKINKLLSFTAALLIVAAAGCAVPKRPSPCEPGNPLKVVAVLPMKNDTVDVDGPNTVRKKMAEILDDRSYTVKDFNETDRILRDRMGISLGGQLDMTTPQQLGETLGVQGVLYGTLMDFDETTTGVLNVRKVRAKFRLVNAATGNVFWERGLGVRSEERMATSAGSIAAAASRAADARDREVPWVTIESYATGRDLKEAAIIGLGTKFFTKAIGRHLDHESGELARRVTSNLPWGPCAAAYAPAPGPKVTITMPEVKMPQPPSFGHMDYGGRDFSAVMSSTTLDKNTREAAKFDVPVARAGKKLRLDMDMSKTMEARGGEDREAAAAFSRMTMLERGDIDVSYTLYPNVKKYMSHKESEAERQAKEPKVEKTRVGSEVIDGHPSDKFRVRITEESGRVHEGHVWNAKDLDGLTIKSETEDQDRKVTTVMKNIILKTPAASLFEIPSDFTEAQSIFELLSEEQKSQ